MGDAVRVGRVKHGETFMHCEISALASYRLIRCIKGLQKLLIFIAGESHLMGLATLAFDVSHVRRDVQCRVLPGVVHTRPWKGDGR